MQTIQLIAFGAMAALAAGAGLTDFLGDMQIRNLNTARLHVGVNILAVPVEAFNWGMRYNGAVVPTSALSSIALLSLMFSGQQGWERAYRHKVGVAD